MKADPTPTTPPTGERSGGDTAAADGPIKPARAGLIGLTTPRTVTRHAVVGYQLATEIMLRRTLQTVLGFVRREARPELLRAMRGAVDQSVASIDLGETATTDEARRAAEVAVAAVFEPLQEEVSLSRPNPAELS